MTVKWQIIWSTWPRSLVTVLFFHDDFKILELPPLLTQFSCPAKLGFFSPKVSHNGPTFRPCSGVAASCLRGSRTTTAGTGASWATSRRACTSSKCRRTRSWWFSPICAFSPGGADVEWNTVTVGFGEAIEECFCFLKHCAGWMQKKLSLWKFQFITRESPFKFSDVSFLFPSAGHICWDARSVLVESTTPSSATGPKLLIDPLEWSLWQLYNGCDILMILCLKTNLNTSW